MTEARAQRQARTIRDCVEPDIETVLTLENVLDQFAARRQKYQVKHQPRYPQGGPIWMIIRQIPVEDGVLQSGVQLHFSDTNLGRELNLIPSILKFPVEGGVIKPPSIPLKYIEKVAGSPVREQLPQWSQALEEKLKQAWRTSLRWARNPDRMLRP